MAKPEKRTVDGESSTDHSDASEKTKATAQSDSKNAEPKTEESKKPESKKPASKRVSKRVTAPQGHEPGHGRITEAKKVQGPSPMWVPVSMFALWAIGLLVIMLNYMEVLPGYESMSGWYLVAGLVAILAGILVATQYR